MITSRPMKVIVADFFGNGITRVIILSHSKQAPRFRFAFLERTPLPVHDPSPQRRRDFFRERLARARACRPPPEFPSVLV
jgi:hypothetical protein